jgi:histidyl-tRNA synthetase
MEQNQVTLRNMTTNEQKTIDYNEVIEEIYKVFDELEDLEDDFKTSKL